jgi:hypothetical protein
MILAGRIRRRPTPTHLRLGALTPAYDDQRSCLLVSGIETRSPSARPRPSNSSGGSEELLGLLEQVRNEGGMSKSDYEKFQDKMFTEIEALEQRRKRWVVEQFVEIGKRVGVDVASEFLDRGRSTSDIFREIEEKQKS